MSAADRPLEMWAGIECTVNRVGDGYLDQLEQSGHAHRDDDIGRMAWLGIRTWRYPLLWERIAPRGPAEADWRWPDRRLGQMRELGLEPIAGLIHHGSGPRGTCLLDPRFPELLAEYAGAVAARYPWIRRWTPVNEPLSTSRFSALDGHWYPHARSHEAFALALVHQCWGIVLSMRAIRQAIPGAELVYTEDVCRQTSTPALAGETRFRSLRRWLGIDLICGRVVPGHPLWQWLLDRGIAARRLEPFALGPVPPDIVGANYYVSSDRFLDERPERHPPSRRFEGREGLYGETDSVRACVGGLTGHRALLAEIWERYRLPVVVTEVHLGCTREEQVRWLVEAWDSAQAARGEGIDVRAVTAWGAFGLFGWDRLVVRAGGTYEPGLFDVRGPSPRPTALARVASALAAGRPIDAPFGGVGWWRRPIRLLGRAPIEATGGAGPIRPLPDPRPGRPLLVIGGGVGVREVARICEIRGLEAVVLGPRTLEPTDAEAVERALDQLRPWAMLHVPGLRSRSPERLASICASRGIRLALLSSRLMTPGRAGGLGEPLVVRAADGGEDPVLTVGLPAPSAVRMVIRVGGTAVRICPLVDAALDLLIDGEEGAWHLARRPSLLELARSAARLGTRPFREGLLDLEPAEVVL